MDEDPWTWSSRPWPHESSPPTVLDLAVLALALAALAILVVVS